MIWNRLCDEVRSSPEGWKARAIRNLTGAVTPVIARMQGMHFPDRRIDEWWWTTRWQLSTLLGQNESQSVAWCRTVVQPGMTVVDAGAHIGYYTRLFSKLVGPKGHVIALEPHPENFKLLKLNTKRCENVTVLEAAAADFNGEAPLHWSAGSSNHSLVQGYASVSMVSTVTVRRLDGIVTGDIDFLKADVEGAEVAVLRGSPPIAAALVECNRKALAAAGSSIEDLRMALSPLCVVESEDLGLDTWNWMCLR